METNGKKTDNLSKSLIINVKKEVKEEFLIKQGSDLHDETNNSFKNNNFVAIVKEEVPSPVELEANGTNNEHNEMDACRMSPPCIKEEEEISFVKCETILEEETNNEDQEIRVPRLERKAFTEIVSSDGQNSEDYVIQDEESENETSPVSVRKLKKIPSKRTSIAVDSSTKRKLMEQQQAFMTTCFMALQQKNIPDEFDAIATNIAAKLRKMKSTQQLLAEGLLNKILLKGMFNELTRMTDITESSPQPHSPIHNNTALPFSCLHSAENRHSSDASTSSSAV